MKSLPTLLEHNARAPENIRRQYLTGPPNGGVLCPLCAKDRAPTEMYERRSSRIEDAFPILVASLVGCPRCGLWAVKF